MDIRQQIEDAIQLAIDVADIRGAEQINKDDLTDALVDLFNDQSGQPQVGDYQSYGGQQ